MSPDSVAALLDLLLYVEPPVELGTVFTMIGVYDRRDRPVAPGTPPPPR